MPPVDAWRPRFHVTGTRNWINDPNGPIQHAGTYHLFYQANPEAPFWGPPAWGHVTSTDLVTWTRQPVALVPEPFTPDADGCWSGCARIVDGRPAIYYTGVVGEDEARVESVCRAWGSDDLLAWEKDAANPLVPGPPEALRSGYHRDPFLWRDGDGWHMLLGGGTTTGERHGQVLRYDSPDATRWTYGGIFFSAPRLAGGLDLGEQWECPQLLIDGDAAALVLSCQASGAAKPLLYAVAFTGVVRDGVFAGELDGKLDHGDVLYAPALFADESERDLLWGWAQERVGADRQSTLSHAGALSLPRDIRLEGGRVRTNPVPELASLRREPLELDDPGLQVPAQCELSATFAVGAGPSGLTLLGPGGEAAVTIAFEGSELRVTVDDGGPRRRLVAPLEASGPHTLRVFADGSLLEVFADGGPSLTTRAYPPSGAWERVRLATGDRASARAWALASDAMRDAPPNSRAQHPS
jgi:beta-fructofuranosidase